MQGDNLIHELKIVIIRHHCDYPSSSNKVKDKDIGSCTAVTGKSKTVTETSTSKMAGLFNSCALLPAGIPANC